MKIGKPTDGHNQNQELDQALIMSWKATSLLLLLLLLLLFFL